MNDASSENDAPSKTDAAPHPSRPRSTFWHVARVLRVLVLHVALPALVLYGAWHGGNWLMSTAPKAEHKARVRSARPVKTARVRPGLRGPEIRALGTVRAARETTLRPRVSGAVARVDPAFVPGGFVDVGTVLIKVDSAEFDLALAASKLAEKQIDAEILEAEGLVAQRATALDEAKAKLRLEEGQGELARRELDMLGAGRQVNRDLVLRTPQLAIAKAAVAAAEAGVTVARASVDAARARLASRKSDTERAQLDVDRVEVVAPFPAWISERHVEEGSYVTSSTNVATLVGTSAYWIEVLVPTSDLKWIQFPAAHSQGPEDVTIHMTAMPDAMWKGRVLRLLGSLDEVGRLARVLVEVQDPRQLARPVGARRPLLLGAVVRVSIPGRPIPNAVSLPREQLRHGDVVWLASDEGKLEFREVDIAWRGEDAVLLNGGLTEADRIVVTDLGTPVEFMALQVAETRVGASNED